MIFAREINDELTSLVKALDRQIEETAQKHKQNDRFGVFVILQSDDAKLHQKLKDLVAGNLKHVVLAVGNADVEQRNKLAKEAAITVSVYNGAVVPRHKSKVTGNIVLKKGELNKQRSNAIFEAVTRALPR